MKVETRILGPFAVIDLVGDKQEVTNEEDYGAFEAQLRKNQDAILAEIDKQIRADKNMIVLNLLKADYIHSGGLGVLARSLKRVWDAKGKLFLIASNRHIRDTIEMTGLKDSLLVYSTEEEFLKDQGPSAG